MHSTRLLALITLIAIILVPMTMTQFSNATMDSSRICKIAIYEVYNDAYAVKICAWKSQQGNLNVEFNIGKFSIFVIYKDTCYLSLPFINFCLIRGPKEKLFAGIAINYIGKATWTAKENEIKFILDPVDRASKELLAEISDVNKELFRTIDEIIKNRIKDEIRVENLIMKTAEITAPWRVKYILDLIDDLSIINDLRENTEDIQVFQKLASQVLSKSIDYDIISVLRGCIEDSIVYRARNSNPSPAIIVNEWAYDIEASGPCKLIKIIG